MPRLPTTEDHRLEETRTRKKYWKRWGPYLSERQWGTVREDYSPGGTAWEYFPHDHARSRAYRWGEDGIGGHQRPAPDDLLCAGDVERARPDFERAALRADRPRGKSRRRCEGVLFLSGFHADAQLHADALQISAGGISLRTCWWRRTRGAGRSKPEFELLDTGVFAENRYFDVFVEYAKADVEDMLIKITAVNRGPEAATLHLLPSLWFRNTWSWGRDTRRPVVRTAVRLRGLPLRGIRALAIREALAAVRGAAGTAVHRKRNRTTQRLFNSAKSNAVRERRVSRISDSRQERRP